ncbi:ABC transporter ATP-binding protein [Chromohalobacter canadensis]|uniref:ABC transporter ATP-binding protein n=1 Tax=Chromohalobacter canadensis TaxID=141389 RepID=A0A285VJB3_9GAMM|nr:ABC transporter ATP-binding protein [Chromohalobacter canadensis]MCK0767930.1 ABC transporter ATP-binding protein [Chromohalobacter canadensis]WQH08499.1 ABC transporter ATP-binding protein [Chromohalobacter canadensis]SOC54204.1 spermidine/putrescine transport system ATP-binding protein [Chromohalobacter canadensis]
MSETMTAEIADHPDARPAANERDRANHKASSIEMQGLHKRFGRDTVALDGVDLNIQAGEFFTLLGPSGCGKTTLLRILAGLEEPDAGSLVVGGKNITEMPPHQRSVNTVFQSYALFPHLSVRENLAFGLKMRGMPAAERHSKVDEIADFIKLGDLVDRHVDQLSGGQRQRIALARALICEPDVLLLDEPLSALDAGLRSQLQVELLRVQKRLGMTFVFVTHDQQEAMVMSDRIAVLNGGTIQQVGAPREVYERPVNAFVAHFMGHDNLYPISARKGDRLITALGELTAEDAGDGELLLIRPETLDLLPGAVEGHNHLTATVAERLYRGSHAEFRLAIADTTLQATVNNRGRHLPEVGETVTVAVAPEDLVTLSE